MCTVSGPGYKTKKVGRSLSPQLDGQCWEVLFSGFALGQTGFVQALSDAFCEATVGEKKGKKREKKRKRKQAATTLVKFIHEWDTAAVTHKKKKKWAGGVTLRWQWVKIESLTFLWTIPHLHQNRKSDPFFFLNQKRKKKKKKDTVPH